MAGEPRAATIRPANPADLDAVRSLDHARARPSTSQSVAELLEARQPRLIVADVDGVIVAFAVVGRFFEHDFVELLFVRPEQRRRGIATQLIAAAEAMATRGKLFTSTNRSNDPMRALCEKLGFEQSGLLEGLDEDDPEVFYVKSLPGPRAGPEESTPAGV
jgi:GNAT superfamily N-acetyltransferase